MKEKLCIIGNVKLVMMLSVVLYHSCMFFTGQWFTKVKPIYTANEIAVFARYLNTFHVQTFTMASGYIFYCLRSEAGKYKDNAYKDIKKRAKRLLLPYFATMIAWVIPFYIYFDGFDETRIINKYIKGYAPSQLWFLPMLFICFCIFYFIADIIPITMTGMVGVTIISVVLGYYLGKHINNWFQIITAINYIPFY